MNIFSFSPFGYEGSLVAVEVDLRRGIPAVDIVGLADGAVKESRERMKAAIRNSGFEFPQERVLISLAPADLKKEGAGFDLALALSILDERRRVTESDLAGEFKFGNDSVLVMGELELSGVIRPVKAVHAAASTASAAGISKCIVSAANAAEAREVSGMKVFGAANLSEAYEALTRPELFTGSSDGDANAFVPEGSVNVNGVLFPADDRAIDFIDIKNQKKLVRALQIAAAGGHNVLAYGPPGCGKTLAMQRFPSLLPLLTVEEAQSTTRIHSLAGLLRPTEPLMRIAPFRMPHQTASIEGICGGGVNCRPGEVSLAHNGVLFLDEAAEFKTSVLQMLRVPVENCSITLSRAGRSTVYPARFQLLMATNPCPCGNYGTEGKICLCSAKAVDMYWRKFSGPLLDRIDIRINVNQLKIAGSGTKQEKTEMKGGTPENFDEKNFLANSNYDSISSAELRKQIADAVLIQRTRQGKRNAYLTPQEILEFCKLGKEEQNLLNSSVANHDFSQRAVSGVLKLSRTIADMEKSEKIKSEHILEAISLRANSGPLGLFSSNEE